MIAIPETGIQVSRIPELCFASTMSFKVNCVFSMREREIKLLLAHFIFLGMIWQSHNCSQLSANPFLGSQGRADVVGVEAVSPLRGAKEFIEASPRRQSKHQPPPASVKSNCITFYRHTADIIE